MNEKRKIDLKNKKMIIVVILLIFMIVGGTLAAILIDITNGNYTYHTQCFNVIYDTGDDITGTLIPSSSLNGGLNGSVTIGIDQSCNIAARGNLFLNVDNQVEGYDILTQVVEPHCEDKKTLVTLTGYDDEASCLANSNRVWVTNGSALKYALYDNTSSKYITVGYISNGNDYINIYNNFQITVSNTYNIYIWLDGELVDNTYQNLSFSGDISAEVEQVVVNEEPVLDDGMIPVTISNNGTATTFSNLTRSVSNTQWYDYSNKEWANAVLVSSSSRSKYLNTNGVVVDPNDILAYYVWIPRYKYRIPNMQCSQLENLTIDINPECYTTPYTMTDEDKELLVNWIFEEESRYTSTYTVEAAREDVENGLLTGTIYVEESDFQYMFADAIEMVNISSETQITYSGTFLPDGQVTGPRTIDIVFESVDSPISKGDAVNSYYTHPAFVWDGESVAGIWVGKFETSTIQTSACYTSESEANCNNTNQEPRILPNVSSLRYQNISNQFQTALKFSGGSFNSSTGVVTFSGNDVYGLTNTTDSHMMKNSEWGAVAYLSHSKYGINTKIRHNNNLYFITGCGMLNEGDNGNSSTQSTYGASSGLGNGECQIQYGNVSSYPQSTTGNITGIFDMAGGAYEYVMGNYENVIEFSGFTIIPENKYFNVYYGINTRAAIVEGLQIICTLETCGGHALNEIEGWYSILEISIDGTSSWYERGGYYNTYSNIFDQSSYSGNYSNIDSFRSVLVVR